MSIQNQIPLERPKHKNQVEDRFNPDKVIIKSDPSERLVRVAPAVWMIGKNGESEQETKDRYARKFNNA